MRDFRIQLVILFLFVVSALSQDKKAILFDEFEFERVRCSVLRGQLDNFLMELAKNTKLHGVVVFSNELDLIAGIRDRAPIEGQFESRKFDPTRLHFVRKIGMPPPRVELWQVANISDLPFNYEPEWNYRVEPETKPFIVYTNHWHDSECHFPTGVEIISRFLRSNSGSRGNIVIRCKDAGCFSQTRKSIQRELETIDNGLVSRVRFFHKRIKSPYFSTEFWLLP